MRVVVLGATGFIGRALTETLTERGDDILILSRRPAKAIKRFSEHVKVVKWSPEYDPSWAEAIEGYDAVVNLAGAPLFGHRWTNKRKELILKSRTESAAGIIKAIRRADHRPVVSIRLGLPFAVRPSERIGTRSQNRHSCTVDEREVFHMRG